ncbi:MAG: NnrU family protein, partial [bacterium]
RDKKPQRTRRARAMSWLLGGIVVFFGVHLIPARPPLRQKLVHAFGESPYKGAFAILSLLGLALMVKGIGAAERVVVWQPPAFADAVAAVAMAPALILLAASLFDNHIRRVARHPMSLAMLLWAGSHLLASSELAALILFASFAAYALFDLRRRDRGERGTAKPVSFGRDALAVIIGLVAYALLVAFHARLFGVAIAL